MIFRSLAAATISAVLMSSAAPAATITKEFDMVVSSNFVLDGLANPLAYLGSTGSGSISFLSGAPGTFFDAISLVFTLNLGSFSQTFTDADGAFGASGELDSTGSGVSQIFFEAFDDDFVNGTFFNKIDAPGIFGFSIFDIGPSEGGGMGTVFVEVQTTAIPLPASLPLALLGLGALGIARKMKRKA
jgi:hypothetical protein